MADVPQTTSLITLAQAFRGDVVRQINRRTQTLKILEIRRGEGKNVGLVPEADGALAENYAEGADAANFGSDAQAPATLGWAMYRSNFRVTGLAQATAASSTTPAGNQALWARNLVNASGKLATLINAGILTGPGTGTTMAGMMVAIGTDNNTYAGIDRSQGANAYWRPTVVDPGVLTPITLPLIRDDLRKIYEASGENCDLAICSPAVFNAVGNLFDATRRQIQEITTARGLVRLEAGFHAIEVDGTMFVKDKDCTANTIHYVNSNHVWVEVLPVVVPPGAKLDIVVPNDGFGDIPLGMAYEPLAKLGDSDRAQVKSYLQLSVERPNTCGTRKNVAA